MNPEIKRGNYAKEKGEVILREHEYDGIQEFDQKLPNWWLFTFYGGIVWFVTYWVLYYHAGWSATDEQKIITQVAALQERKDAELAATLASLDDKTLIEHWASDPAVVAAGEATYAVSCSACHAADLSAMMDAGGTKIALPGRPLTDGHWEYGSKPMEIFKLINEGTPAEATGYNGAKMQAWGQILTPKQVAEVTAFLISKNPQDFGS
ncbi:cbb3-type cytochrome c oxidase N-terminal domain-containing protein [Luteolibacter luteus]|uniref:C-type cytochrome n=1 Tax=Luteolibacter luteus TaxID=2728835 RepID=A0A858RGH3_9BACT|nr:cbb3-type cytochrome c oxidase N-terminal domain-containing protein [Luteolibacter luteus]QJE95390.1 c-type cytochrome [Luteolibacter luteus]